MQTTQELAANYFHAWLRQDAAAAYSFLHTDFKYWEIIAGEMNRSDFFRFLNTWFNKPTEMFFTYDFLDAGIDYAVVRYYSYFNYPGNGFRIKLEVISELFFHKDKIISQNDSIDLYQFSRQAYGIFGLIFGHSLFMHKMLARQMRYPVWLANPKMDAENPLSKKLFFRSSEVRRITPTKK
ncbi:nuclear transport factor 2 family protein [Flavobacterium sp.]|uniref:nuclear transport factor 2 family protein n=1 Tax=Flavobacterium sp. TaxID=239 RepID=UPI0026319A45|nr:nuclear transport factor 2 family protein [Flavobacterium sp.]